MEGKEEKREFGPMKKRFFQRAFSALAKITQRKLTFAVLAIVKSKRLFLRIALKYWAGCLKQLESHAFFKWKAAVERRKKILNGMKIIERQKKRKEVGRKAESGNYKDSGEIRAWYRVWQILFSLNLKCKRDVFKNLIKELYDSRKVESYLYAKNKRLVLKSFYLFKESSFRKLEKKSEFFFKMKELIKQKLQIPLKRILKDASFFKQKSHDLGFRVLEDLAIKKTSKYFNTIAFLYKNFNISIKLAIIILDKIIGKKIRLYWKGLKNNDKRNKKKKEIAISILQKILLKLQSAFFHSIQSTPLSVTSAKISLGLEKLKKFNRKIQRKGFSSFHILIISKYQKFAGKAVTSKIQKLLTSQKFQVFLSVKSHYLALKTEFLLIKFVKTLFAKLQNHKNLGLKSLKNYSKLKKKQEIIWKEIFYRLEGLIQYKNESLSLKTKLKTFYKWKNYIDEVQKINEKIIQRRSNRFIKSLKNTEKKIKTRLVIHSFLSIKTIWESKKRSLKILKKIHEKQQKFQFFNILKSLNIAFLHSPKARKTLYTPSQSSFFSSPTLQLPNRPSLKKYAFYSTKRLSIDHSVQKYIDHMMSVAPPMEKALSVLRDNLKPEPRFPMK